MIGMTERYMPISMGRRSLHIRLDSLEAFGVKVSEFEEIVIRYGDEEMTLSPDELMALLRRLRDELGDI